MLVEKKNTSSLTPSYAYTQINITPLVFHSNIVFHDNILTFSPFTSYTHFFQLLKDIDSSIIMFTT